MELQDRYFLKIAASFVRGKIKRSNSLFEKDPDELTNEDLEVLFNIGKSEKFKMHRFKRTMGLPRVDKVLGIFQGIQPTSLLDIGTGRGVFLFPLLDVQPDLPVTCVDVLEHRVALLEAIRDGGWRTLEVEQQDAGELTFDDNQFDVVTILEVLEHIPALERAIRDLCRVARRYIVFSVPSKEDDNPEHIHLLNTKRLTELFTTAGAKSVKFEYSVRNHLVGLVKL